MFTEIKIKNIFVIFLGAAIVSFGIYNIHDVAKITEGGIFGLDLFFNHWFHISPAYTNFILSAICFFIGWKALGKSFIINSAFAIGAFSFFYKIFEKTPHIFPNINEHPWIASFLGAIFVGIGTGLCVVMNGAQSGDDALSMALNKFFGWKISAVYLVSDLIVLILSLSYIPVSKIIYSLVSVILSGQLIEIIKLIFERMEKRKKANEGFNRR